MKKQLTAGRVVRYLLYLCIASALVFGFTYARYILGIHGQGTASTAAVALNVTDGSSNTLDLTTQLQGLQLGATKEIVFAVTNQKGGIVSEVAQDYTVSVYTTGNLPLTYTLLAQDSDAGTYVANPISSSDGSMVWAGGRLPYAEKGVTHTYTLTAEWPSNQADESLTDEIDLVTLTVDTKQALPVNESEAKP